MPKPEGQVTEPTTDDLGYDLPPEEITKPKEEVSSDIPKPDDKPKDEEIPAISGYEEIKPKDETPPKVEDKPKDETPPSDEEKIKAEIISAAKSLGDGYDHEAISSFALSNKLTPEQVKAYADFAKAQDEKAVKMNEQRVLEQRQGWFAELKSDPDFGGKSEEDFKKNIHKVSQLIEKNMPNVKKMLTDKKGMLPPSFMRDLLALSKALNPTTKFEGGEPPASQEESKHFLDEMYE